MKTIKVLSFDEFKTITKEQDEKRIENVYLMDITSSGPICMKIVNLTFDSIIHDVLKSPEYVFFEIIGSENEISENKPDSENRYLEEMKRVTGRIYIHHIEPITKEDIVNHSSKLFDPNNLISVSDNTHKALTYCRNF